MSWYIYLPIAQHSIALPVVVGLLSGLFGVGFLMTPLLIMFGIPPTVAAASDSNQIVAASASGTYAHYRLGNVDFKMGIYLLIGGVIGELGEGFFQIRPFMVEQKVFFVAPDLQHRVVDIFAFFEIQGGVIDALDFKVDDQKIGQPDQETDQRQCPEFSP